MPVCRTPRSPESGSANDARTDAATSLAMWPGFTRIATTIDAGTGRGLKDGYGSIGVGGGDEGIPGRRHRRGCVAYVQRHGGALLVGVPGIVGADARNAGRVGRNCLIVVG